MPLLVLALVVPMVLPGPDGEPVVSWRDWLPEVPETLSPLMPASTPDTIYRWQDSAGKWHFSDDPLQAPPGVAGGAAPLPVNRLPVPPAVPEDADSDAPSAGMPAPLTVPMTQVPKMIEDAKHLQTLMDQRGEALREY